MTWESADLFIFKNKNKFKIPMVYFIKILIGSTKTFVI